MKKVISILLVLVIALSLCACSKNSKFVGTYTGTAPAWSSATCGMDAKLTLNADGTGTQEQWLKEDCTIGKKGDLVHTESVHWVESDGYITITFTKTFCPYSEICSGNDSYTITYELKGLQLMRADGETHYPLTKVD